MDDTITPQISDTIKKGKKGIKRGPTKILKYPIPVSKTSFESHVKVLRALNIGSNKGKNFVSYTDIAPYAGVTETTVSKILKFFNEIGFTETGERGKYKPKSEIIEFLNELEWDQSEATKVFGNILMNTWFGQSVIQFFKMKKEISKDELVRSFGKCAQADTSNQAELNVLLKFLEYGGIIGIVENTANYSLLIDENQIDQIERSHEVQIQEESEKSVIKDSRKKKDDSHPHIEKREEKIYAKTKQPSISGQNAQVFTSGTLTIHLNIPIDENTDIDKIAEKILRLKESIK